MRKGVFISAIILRSLGLIFTKESCKKGGISASASNGKECPPGDVDRIVMATTPMPIVSAATQAAINRNSRGAYLNFRWKMLNPEIPSALKASNLK